MHTAIRNHVLPMVDRVKIDGFNKDSFGHCMGLHTRIQKHVESGNAKKVRNYLAFCITTWPDLDTCPIDRKLLKRAVQVLDQL